MLEQKVKIARISIISNAFLVLAKLGVGITIQSMSVISEGIHSGLDLIAAIIAYLAVRKSGQPADDNHHYGHGKIENLSGTLEALLIFVAALWILYESVHKLQVGGGVETVGIGVAVMAVSAIINWFISNRLLAVARQTESIALKADGLHLRTDVYTSLGVFAGLVAIHFTGWHILDPIAAIAVALLIIKAAYDLLKQALHPLLDASLSSEELEAIRTILKKYEGQYLEFHDLRTRRSGSDRHVDLHLVMPEGLTLEEAHALSHRIEDEIKVKYPSTHVLIHYEPCCEEHGKGKCLEACKSCEKHR